jgi:zinc protease
MGDTPLSAAQRLTLAESLLPQIGADEVGAASRQTFSPRRRRLVLIVPSRMPGAPPGPLELARVARRASLVARSARTGPAERQGGSGSGLLDDDPEPGDVSEQSEDAQSQTTSITLSNGVRVHVRPMTERRDEVRVQVTLAGGELLETAATRGLSEAAALAFETPTTDRLSGPAIRAALVGHDVALSGCACDGDAITAELVTGRADLETGMRLLHLVLTRGRITKAALDDWKARDLAWANRETSDPELRVSDELPAALTERDPRAQPLSVSQVSRVDVGAAQTWFEHHRDTAPMEVAMVGDADPAELIRLARKYLGSLPARPRRDARLEALRRPHPSTPAEGSVTFALEGVVPRAAIAVTWRRPDRESPAERDAIEVGAAVLTERLRQELRERRGLTYDVSFDLARPSALRGANVMTASLSTDPRHAFEAAQLVRRVVASFAAGGPTPEELATARRQVQSQRAADARLPSAWADLLAAKDFRGTSLSRLAEPLDHLDAVAADDIRATIGRCIASEAPVAIVAAPRWNLVFGLRVPRRSGRELWVNGELPRAIVKGINAQAASD